MQKLRSQSRSIINDPIEKRVSQIRFKNHKQAIKKINHSSTHASLRKSIDFDKSQQYAVQISRYKKANVIVNQNIDPTIAENRSLVRKMQEIDKRKSRSVASLRVPFTSKHKIFADKIREQNKAIFERIRAERENVKSKKQLKKESAEVDKLIMHSRRIKQAIKKVKKDKKSINFKFGKQQKQFVFVSQTQSMSPTLLILR